MKIKFSHFIYVVLGVLLGLIMYYLVVEFCDRLHSRKVSRLKVDLDQLVEEVRKEIISDKEVPILLKRSLIDSGFTVSTDDQTGHRVEVYSDGTRNVVLITPAPEARVKTFVVIQKSGINYDSKIPLSDSLKLIDVFFCHVRSR